MHLGCACDSGFAYPAQDHHVGAGDMEQETPPQIAVGLRLHILPNRDHGSYCMTCCMGVCPHAPHGLRLRMSIWQQKHHSTVCSHCPGAAAFVSCHRLITIGQVRGSNVLGLAAFEPKSSRHGLASNSTVCKSQSTYLDIIRALAALQQPRFH